MENFAKTFSHEPLIRFSLDVNQMRHWQYFIDSGITVPSPITYGNRFKHVIPHPLMYMLSGRLKQARFYHDKKSKAPNNIQDLACCLR